MGEFVTRREYEKALWVLEILFLDLDVGCMGEVSL